MSLPPNGDAEMEAECEEMENNWAGEEEQAAVVHNIKVLVVVMVVMNFLMVIVVEAEAVVVQGGEHEKHSTQIVLGIFWHS